MTDLHDIISSLDLTDWYNTAEGQVQSYLRDLIADEVPDGDKTAFVEGFLHGSHKAISSIVPDMVAPWSQRTTMGRIFMSIFRNDEFQSLITNDDKVEVFMTVLAGESDLTTDLIQELYAEYGKELEKPVLMRLGYGNDEFWYVTHRRLTDEEAQALIDQLENLIAHDNVNISEVEDFIDEWLKAIDGLVMDVRYQDV